MSKVAYVTGGMGGIGTAICRKFHDLGHTVIAGCGPTRNHEKWLAEQKADGYHFVASVGNVADWESTKLAFEAVVATHGRVDILVNNAGITRDGVFRKMSLEDWRAVIDTNLNSSVQRHQAGDRGHAGAQLGPDHQHLVGQRRKRASSARATTRRPRRACTVSRWRWRRKWPARA
jgi:NAD(P)-dependent dehydrogenase (short-subunit alcohol dehydrogenase family)